jgi:hypothetical protein
MEREVDYTLLIFIASTNITLLCVLVTVQNPSKTAVLVTLLFAVLAGYTFRIEWRKLTRIQPEEPPAGAVSLTGIFRTLASDAQVVVQADKDKPLGIIGGYEPVMAGSTASLCWDCGKTVYLSDSLEISKQWPGVPVLCLMCAFERDKKVKV